MHAELGRFLHDYIHAFAPRNPLHEANPQRRLRITCKVLADIQLQFVSRELADCRGIFSAAAVKDRQLISRSQAQDTPDVVSSFTAERQRGVSTNLERTKKTMNRHGLILRPLLRIAKRDVDIKDLQD